MNFISIPQNGSSWRGPLRYTVETADGSEQEIGISIYLTNTNQIIGRLIIYGASRAEFDIAPYLRDIAPTEITNADKSAVVTSPSAMSVHVVVNGVASESRVFFEQPIDTSGGQVLTLLPENRPIALGEMIRFTVNTNRNLRIVVTQKSAQTEQSTTLVHMTHSMPSEVVIPTEGFSPDTTHIRVVVWCDAVPVKTFNYRIIEPTSSAVRLVWRNRIGGVESYTFPCSHRIEYKSVVNDIEIGGRVRSIFRSGSVVRRLTTLPTMSEMEALAEIVFADTVYCETKGELIPVVLKTRKVGFDDHDALHKFSLDIESKWRGGEQ